MRFGDLEFRSNPIRFYALPTFFSHKAVEYDEDNYADEVGCFFLGFCVSFYFNKMTFAEMRSRKNNGNS